MQLFNNVGLMIYGYAFLNFHRDLTYLIPTFMVSFLVDYLCGRYFNPERNSRSMWDRSISIGNTMAAIFVMANVDDPWFYFLAICFGIAAKYIFQIKNQHLFNPGNIGIVLSLLFVTNTYVRIIYNQFAMSNYWVLAFVIINGLIITLTANRFVLAMAYMLGTAGFLYALSPYFNYSRTMLIGPTLSISGIVFIFFMITDPKTTPSKWSEQVIFGLVCAFIGAIMRMNEMVHDSFVALFLTTALYTIIRYDRLHKANQPAIATAGTE